MAVKQKFTGDVAQLEAAYHKIAAQNTKLIEQNRRLATQTRAANRRASTGASRVASRVLSQVGAYMSVAVAIRAVTQAIEDKEATERKARDATVSIAGAQANAIRMLGDATAAEQQRFITTVEQIAATTRPAGGQATVYTVSGAALSGAKGDTPLALAAVRTALQIAPESPTEAQTIASGILGLGVASGSRNMKENLGQLLGLTAMARPESVQQVAEFMVPAMVSSMKRGGTIQEQEALGAAISHGLQDWKGRRTGTAQAALVESLADFLPEEASYRWTRDPRTGKARKEVERAATGLTSTAERLAFLQKNAEARGEFLASKPVPPRAMATVEGLLTAGSEEERTYRKALAAIPQPAAAVGMSERMIAGIQRPWQQQVAAQTRTTETLVEQLHTTGVGKEAAQAAQYQWGGEKGLGAQLEAGGRGSWGRTADWFDYRILAATVGEREAYRGALETRQMELLGVANLAAWERGAGERSYSELKSASVLAKRLEEDFEAGDRKTFVGSRELERQIHALEEAARKMPAGDAGAHLDAHAEPN